jgi:nucleoside-diphosphate-sugar epimerase
MGMSHVVPELLHRAHRMRAGEGVRVYSPSHERTFCYVDDAVELIIRLAQSDAGANEVFNVGSTADAISIAALGDIVLRTVGKQQWVDRGPEVEGSPVRRRPDMTRAIAATGWQPSVSLADGVEQTWIWYRSNVFAEQAAAAGAQLSRRRNLR